MQECFIIFLTGPFPHYPHSLRFIDTYCADSLQGETIQIEFYSMTGVKG